MLAKRIIPCLDIKDGQTVKGTNFVNLRQAGDPVELGKAYSEQGADELVYLDITASHEGRKTFTDLVKRIAAHINIPFTVGGGINELKDVDRLLNAGADKVSINSAAIRNPMLVDEIAKHFGSQVCVVAIDARQTANGWKCYLNGGRVETERYLYEWAKEVNDRGAGEILLRSENRICQRSFGPSERNTGHSCNCFRRSRKDGTLQRRFYFRKSRCRTCRKRFPLWRDTYNETERISSQRRYLSKNLNTYIIRI